MKSKWEDIPAQKFCYQVTDGTHDSPKPQPEGRYLITSKHLTRNGLDYTKANRISEADYQKIIQRSSVERGDVLFSMIGTVGRVYQEHSENPQYACKNVAIFKFNHNFTNATWMYYYLQSPTAQEYIHTNLRGSTQKYVPLSCLRQMPILVPPPKTRHQIAAVLGALDDKIETNDRIIKNLQEQITEQFNHLYSQRDQDGWTSVLLNALANVKYGKAGKDLADGALPMYGSGGLIRRVDASPLYSSESILIPRKGSLNNIVLVDEPFWVIDTMFYTEMKKPHVGKYLYEVLKSIDFASMNVGSAVPSMTRVVLDAIEVPLPPQGMLQHFDYLAEVLFAEQKALNEQNKVLTQLRDTLLPLLVSGELDVSKVPLDDSELTAPISSKETANA